MEKQFKSVLKNEDFNLIGYKTPENEVIKSQKVSIIWSIDPQAEDWGFRYWRANFLTFSADIILFNEETEEERTVQFDCLSQEFELEIDMSKYKMSQDFVVTRVEINRETKKAVAFVQG